MSFWSRDEGTITLPAKDVARVRKVARDESNSIRAAALAKARDIRRSITTKSPRVFAEHMAASEGERVWGKHVGFFIGPRSVHRFRDGGILTRSQVIDVAATKILLETHDRSGATMLTPSESDAEAVLPTVTNRSSKVRVLGRWGTIGTLTFSGRTVTWISDSDTEHARLYYPVIADVLRALGSTSWTRSTGGVIVGHNEHSAEAGYSATVSYSFGPSFPPVGTDHGFGW